MCGLYFIYTCARLTAPPMTLHTANCSSTSCITCLLLQWVCAMQAVRPDRLGSAMTSFVCSTLGLTSITPPPLAIAPLLRQQASAGEPLVMRPPWNPLTPPPLHPSPLVGLFHHHPPRPSSSPATSPALTGALSLSWHPHAGCTCDLIEL